MVQIVILMGVSGCGKTSVGEALSKLKAVPFFDADDFHPYENKEKMKSGIPLNDQDRIPWLKTLNTLCKKHAKTGMILACSSLKESYREELSKDLEIDWVYLKGSFELIQSRMQKRKGHYMPAALLQSQFDTLEEPTDALVVDIDQSVESIVAKIQQHI